MQLFHKYRLTNTQQLQPCGGRLIDSGKDLDGERQYECAKCRATGHPATDYDPDCEDDNPISLDGLDACVCSLLIPRAEVVMALKYFSWEPSDGKAN
jgi:hypothetical protein